MFDARTQESQHLSLVEPRLRDFSFAVSRAVAASARRILTIKGSLRFAFLVVRRRRLTLILVGLTQ